MTNDAFFNQLSDQFLKQLPFVAYRKPNNIEVKAILQDTDDLFFTQDFTESGFVFSSFIAEEDAILFPLNKCETISCQDTIEDLKNESFSKTIESTGKEKHIKLVQKAITSIEDGSFKKVVLSRVEIQQFDKSEAIHLFKKLLSNYKSAMVYCWYHPKVGLWLGATPETLLKIEGKRLQTMSLAGTQPFNDNAEVIWQSKEIEEQQLVTNFIVGSLQSSVSSLTVGKPETVKAGNILHLRSKISGVLNPENGLRVIIQKLHPTPAVCGLPKDVTFRFILDNEAYNREFYTGFFGELNLKQSKTRNTNRRNVENNAYASVKNVSHLFVNLRCLQIKDNQALIYVGGGITKDSDPELEWEETVAKSKTVKNLL
ncbi:chorismate-binding protein [Olleya sp. R77988]|uniref:chorismate-binding protein n=1 Tax=Olleya sp. R77988 TaxID=3093875 RepID=UPI0037C99D91